MGNITNLIKGGVGDTSAPENIDPTQLALGVQVEMEHTNDPKIAKELAIDHLTEIPDYYSRLAKAGLADEFTTLPNSGYGDPDAPFNDPARTGNGDNRHTNMGGTVGNTPSGQVSGRRSEPIHNKTIDIELEEEAFDPTVSNGVSDSGTYNSGYDFIGMSEKKEKILKIREYIKRLANEDIDPISSWHDDELSDKMFAKLTPKQETIRDLIIKKLKSTSSSDKNDVIDVLNAALKNIDEYDFKKFGALPPVLLSAINTYAKKELRKSYSSDIIRTVYRLLLKIFEIDNSTISENMKKTKLSLKDQLRKLISEEMLNINNVFEQDNDDLEVDAEDNEVTITLDKGLAQAIYDALTDVLEIEDEEGEGDPEATAEPASDVSAEPQAPQAPQSAAEPAPEAPVEPQAPQAPAEPAPEEPNEDDEEESQAVQEAKHWIKKSGLREALKKSLNTRKSYAMLSIAAKKGGKLGQRNRINTTIKKIK